MTTPELFSLEWWRAHRPPRPADPGPFYDVNMDAFDAAFEEGYRLGEAWWSGDNPSQPT